jgi:hypothetical protein
MELYSAPLRLRGVMHMNKLRSQYLFAAHGIDFPCTEVA